MLRIIMHGTSQHLLYIVDLSCQVHAACIMIYCFHAQTQKPQFLTLFLAFATRRIPVKGIDDTKFIAGAVYITSILLAVIIVSTYTMKDLVNWGAVVFCTGIIIVTTAILSLVFVPKVANTWKLSLYPT